MVANDAHFRPASRMTQIERSKKFTSSLNIFKNFAPTLSVEMPVITDTVGCCYSTALGGSHSDTVGESLRAV